MVRISSVVLLASVIGLGGCGGAGADTEAVTADATEKKPASAQIELKTTPLPAVRAGNVLIEPGGVDFGLIASNSKLDFEVTIRNTGPQPVTVARVQSTCQCTAPEDLTNTVIEPGGFVPLSSTFKAHAFPGPQDAKIVLHFRERGRQNAVSAVLRVESEVTLIVRAQPAYADCREVNTGTVVLDAIDGRPFRVLTTQGARPDLVGGNLGAATSHTVRWTINYPRNAADCDNQRSWWIIETDHPDCPIVPIRIRHECTGLLVDPDYRQRGWLPRGDAFVNLGAIRAGEPVEADIKIWRLQNRSTAGVLAVASMTRNATAEIVEILEPPDDDTYVKVRFTPSADYEGMLYAMVNVKSKTGDRAVAFVSKVVQ